MSSTTFDYRPIAEYLCVGKNYALFEVTLLECRIAAPTGPGPFCMTQWFKEFDGYPVPLARMGQSLKQRYLTSRSSFEKRDVALNRFYEGLIKVTGAVSLFQIGPDPYSGSEANDAMLQHDVEVIKDILATIWASGIAQNLVIGVNPRIDFAAFPDLATLQQVFIAYVKAPDSWVGPAFVWGLTNLRSLGVHRASIDSLLGRIDQLLKGRLGFVVNPGVLSQIRGSTGQPASAPAKSDWDLLLGDLTDRLVLTEFSAMIKAAAREFPGVGALGQHFTGSYSVRNAFNVVRNQQPNLLPVFGKVVYFNRAELSAVVQCIVDRGFFDTFFSQLSSAQRQALREAGPRPVKLDAMEGVQSTVKVPALAAGKTPREWLRAFLNPRLTKSTETDAIKDANIDAALTSKKFNDFIRERVPWFLPETSTLHDVLENCSGDSGALIAVLVTLAEQNCSTVREPLFEIDAKLEFDTALAELVESLPLGQLLFFDPRSLPDEQERRWLSLAGSGAISKAELCSWADQAEFAGRELSQKQMDAFFDKISDKLVSSAKFRATVLQAVLEKKHLSIPPFHWNELTYDRFKPAQTTDSQALSFTVAAADAAQAKKLKPEDWRAAAMLASLKIVNQQLGDTLAEFEDCREAFQRDFTRQDLCTALRQWGATGAQPSKILMELEKYGLIAASQ